MLPPEIVSKGFVDFDESDDLFNTAKTIVLNTIKKYVKERTVDLIHLKDLIKDELDIYFKKETGINPMVIPIIIET